MIAQRQLRKTLPHLKFLLPYMTIEIEDFASAIGALPFAVPPGQVEFARHFARRNYYRTQLGNLIVKISRGRRHWWGFGKAQSDFFDQHGGYFLVLLASSREGWMFSRDEIRQFIDQGRWKLNSNDNNYKVNWPLPDRNSFSSREEFLQRLSKYGSVPLRG
ncbi:MAG: hypothetical protein ACREQX_17005 [Candidatus Binataceae bacterium]